MDAFEQEIADSLYAAMMKASDSTERSQQSHGFKVGMSDLGFCSERTLRMLKGIKPAEEQDWLPAIVGTAVGDWIEREAVPLTWPDAIIQSEVTVVLKGDTGTYNITGHPDVIVPSLGLVLDNKGTNGLAKVEKMGPTAAQRYQRMGYGKGAWEAGMFGDIPLEQVRVGNVWHDRSAGDRRLHVQVEQYDENVLIECAQWLDDVVYAYLNNAEVRKEPPREMCQKVCGHFSTCRALDTDVEGLLTAPEVLAGVDMYLEGKEMERQGKRLATQAQLLLKGISGSTGKYTVRWTQINGGHVEYDREPYLRLDLKKVR